MKSNKLIIIAILLISVIGVAIYGVYEINKYHYVDTIVHESEALSFVDDEKYFESVDALMEYQNYAQTIIDGKEDITFGNAHVIYNPYSIDRFSANIYFDYTSKYPVDFAYIVKIDGLADYYEMEEHIDANSNHAYTINGLVPGYTNVVTTYLFNEYQLLEEKEYVINFEAIEEVEVKLEMPFNLGEEQALNDYLFGIIGKNHDMPNGSTMFYDQHGIIRAELLTSDNYRADRIINYNDGYIFSYDDNIIISVDRLNKIDNIYYLWEYQMHHDYLLNDKNELIVLASNKNTETIEDILISVNLDDGSITELIDFKTLMPEIYEYAKENNIGNNYGSDYLDWIHINSIDFVDEDSLLFSARELSAVIKVDDIYINPQIDYVISKDYIFESISKDHKLAIIDDENNFYGQHSLQVTPIDETSYYLELFNNAWANSPSYPNMAWDKDKATVNFVDSDAKSYYEKYLIDEEMMSAKLVDTYEAAYSPIVSSVQSFGDYIIVGPGYNLTYGTGYSIFKNGEKIKEFKFDKNYSVYYRVYSLKK